MKMIHLLIDRQSLEGILHSCLFTNQLKHSEPNIIHAVAPHEQIKVGRSTIMQSNNTSATMMHKSVAP